MSYYSKSRLDLCGDYFVRKPEIGLRNPKQYVNLSFDRNERGTIKSIVYTQSRSPSAGLFGRRSENWCPFLPEGVSPSTIQVDSLQRQTNDKQRSRWMRRADPPWSPPTYIMQYTSGSQAHFELEANLLRTPKKFQKGGWKSRSAIPRYQRFSWSN